MNKDNNNNIETLNSCLKQEIVWVEQLNALLSEEKVVLATRQFNQLEDLADKKQELSSKLEDSAKIRAKIIGINDDASPKANLKQFLKTCTESETSQINKLNNALAERLNICRELNTVNGQVIANNIHTRQQIVNALSNKSNAVNVYTATGDIKPSAAGDGGHHTEA